MPKESAPANHKDGGENDYEAHEAMHTLMRAGEIIKDKKLMMRVKKRAGDHADKMRDVSRQANALAKAGRISPKALERFASK